jgi:arylformamidase
MTTPLRKNGGKMRIYDISLTVSPEIPIWPGDPSIVVERIATIKAGSEVNLTRLEMCAHSGTHVDAPFHILTGDVPTVDQLSLKLLSGRAYLLSLPDCDLITASVLQSAEIPPRTRRLLFKTRNSAYWSSHGNVFQENYVGLSKDGAQWLVDKGVKLVGIDYLSIAPYNDTRPTHEILLKAGAVVIEGLDLSKVSQGRYTLHCLPLKLAGADGAPARAILIGV